MDSRLFVLPELESLSHEGRLSVISQHRYELSLRQRAPPSTFNTNSAQEIGVRVGGEVAENSGDSVLRIFSWKFWCFEPILRNLKYLNPSSKSNFESLTLNPKSRF